MFRRAADGSPRVLVFCSSGFPARDLSFCGTGGGGVSREAAKTRREDAKGRWRWPVFEYEYEYRPPGRTEYEYEGGIGGQCSVFGRAADGRPRVVVLCTAAGGVCGAVLGVSVSGVAFGVLWGVWAPSPPTPLPRFTGARGGLVRRAADGSPRVWWSFVARAFQPEFCPFAALGGGPL